MLERIFLVIPFIVIIIIWLISFFILTKNYKSKTNRFFFFMIMFLSIWMIFNLLEDLVFFKEYSPLFTRLDFFFAPIAAYFFYLFCQTFPFLKWNNLFSRIILLLLTIGLSFLSVKSFMIKNMVFKDGVNIEFQPTIYLYGIGIAGILLIGTYIIFQKYRKSHGTEKKQILYLLIGFIGLILFLLISNLVLPIIFENVPTISRIGSIGIIFFIFMTAYAILKYHLFEIRIVATETLVALIVLVLFIQALLSKTWTEGMIRGTFLLLVAYFGYFLIRSVIQEIERRKQIEKLTKELEKANLNLQELDKLKSEFVSIASHDLLTPVAAIEGYLSMILDEKIIKIDEQKDPRLKIFLSRIYSSSKRLARLITDLLNISRIEEGRLLVQKKPYDISPIIESVINELAIQTDQHHLYLKYHQPKVEVPKIFADIDQVKEVLVNLIGNAVKFTRTGGITIELEIVPKEEIKEKIEKLDKTTRDQAEKNKEMLPRILSTKSKEIVGDKQLVIHIKDTGVGISQKELPALFQKFYRAGQGWTVTGVQGTGLGLYISKSLVELNNGRIWVESKLGEGSVFSFSLPFAKEAQVLEQDQKQKIHQDEIQLKPLAKGPAREI